MDDKESSFFLKQKLICLDIIAKGGYATVFYVFHTQYRTYFALKKVPECQFEESELQCLIGIDDQKIVNLYKYFKFNGSIYLLMEYCPDDLENYIKNHPVVSEAVIYKHIQGVITSIKACHDRNIAHRDIKPSNFLIDKYDRIKISDFGLSRKFDANSTCKDNNGTPLFMAPEIIQQKEHNPMQSDVWALGITIYFLVTGDFPFYSNSKDQLNYIIERGEYSSQKITDPLIKHIISRCLTIDATKRPTVDQILEMPYFTCRDIPRARTLSTKHDPILKPRVANCAQRDSFLMQQSIINKVKSFSKLRKARCKSTDVVLNDTFILADN